jgi:neurotransmitter:Na+ symporter, NSS family
MFKQKEYWASRTGLILAMAGNAVGLGNFLRFPAQAVHNGGGAFIIPYLVSFLVMGLPLLYVEWAIGRYGGRFGHHQTTGMFYIIGGSRIWGYIGILGVFNCLAVASYYLYIESWTFTYAFYSVSGVFGEKTSEEISVFFSSYLGTVDNSIINISSAGVFFFYRYFNIKCLDFIKGIE